MKSNAPTSYAPTAPSSTSGTSATSTCTSRCRRPTSRPSPRSEQWGDIYDRLAGLIRAHKTTLVFVNTRRLSERVAHQLSQRLGEDHVASHHGCCRASAACASSSDSRPATCRPSSAPRRWSSASTSAASTSSARSARPAASRPSCSASAAPATPWASRRRGVSSRRTRDELVECAALVRAVRAGRLDRVNLPIAPLDILAQQIVAEVQLRGLDRGRHVRPRAPRLALPRPQARGL